MFYYFSSLKIISETTGADGGRQRSAGRRFLAMGRNVHAHTENLFYNGAQPAVKADTVARTDKPAQLPAGLMRH